MKFKKKKKKGSLEEEEEMSKTVDMNFVILTLCGQMPTFFD